MKLFLCSHFSSVGSLIKEEIDNKKVAFIPTPSARLTDVDPDTGCKEFEIEKGRFSFRLTAPYREERRSAASEAAKNE
ncbi:MAG: hypothetical protein ACLR71_05130 [[Clostridium] scindens]